MRINLVVISGALAWGMLAGVPARAQESAPAVAPAPDITARIAAAQAAEDALRFDQSIPLWVQLAEQGVPDAQVHLGNMYHQGSSGVCRDDARAVEWLTRAADQGSIDAYRNLGEVYDSYNSPRHDPDKAVAWYQKAAELDDAASQVILSQKYWNGEGVPRDHVKAIYWLEKAAAHPRPVSIFLAYDLGNIYSDGKDVPPNEEKAIYWYLKAANGGLTNAQFKVAEYYEKQQGFTEAYYWYSLVKAPAAVRNRMAAKLTPAQLAEVKKRVADTKFPKADVLPPPATPLTTGCPR